MILFKGLRAWKDAACGRVERGALVVESDAVRVHTEPECERCESTGCDCPREGCACKACEDRHEDDCRCDFCIDNRINSPMYCTEDRD